MLHVKNMTFSQASNDREEQQNHFSQGPRTAHQIQLEAFKLSSLL